MKRKWAYLLAALLLLVVLVGCRVNIDSGPSSYSHSFAGYVRSASGEGLGGVKILFNNMQVCITDTYGYWSGGYGSGDLEIKPERRGFTFEPDAYYFTANNSNYNLNFTVTGFTDDFSVDTGWDVGGDGDGQYGYLNNEYQINAYSSPVAFTSLAPVCIGRNYTVKARGYVNSGSGYYGMAFNLINFSSYYYVFRIKPDERRYQLLRVVGDIPSIVINANSPAIFTSAANLLKVEQKGDLISLSVNGTLLENDYSIAGDSHYGSSYLYAGLYGESSVINTDFRFDDFELYAAVINDFSVFKASGLLGVGKVHKDIGR